ncbi:MAG: tetratricopeptide repeat protein [Pseudomonadota bacterium]
MITLNFPDGTRRPTAPAEAFRQALAWLQGGQAEPAAQAFEALASAGAGAAEAWRLAGIARLTAGQGARAAGHFAAALKHTPSVETTALLGRAWLAAGERDKAQAVFEQGLERWPEAAPLHHELAAFHHAAGALEAATVSYEAALALAPQKATFRANLAAALAQQGNARAAREHAAEALRQKPDLGPAYKVLGTALADLGDFDPALVALSKAVKLSPDADSWYQLGAVRDHLGQWDEALAAFEAALRLNPAFGPALSEALFLRRRLCRWAGADPLEQTFEASLKAGAPGLKPFSFLSQVDDPALHQRCARLWAQQLAARAGTPLPTRDVVAGRLTVGYLSSGFHRHPTACLTAEYFERHDRSRLRPLAFSVGPDDDSTLRQRIRGAVEAFHDLRGASYRQIAQEIRAAGVDVLVDLRGYGGGAVSEALALRPAPVQVNWLAYPGTLGSRDRLLADYTVLDRYLATDTVLAHLDEAPLVLPRSYQPTDTTREFAAQRTTREACGLPPKGMVYVSFNNSYKFSPPVFARWMNVLKAVPGSVLWLLAGKAGTSTDANLKAEAERRGVAPERLVMMPKLPHLEYLARYELADLFLDTSPYNAHTTASDALWAGCPVLTVAGRSFASRVAGSLLTSAGLGDLVVEDWDSYEALAVQLGRSAEAREALKSRTAAARTSALFDTVTFCRHMADGLIAAAERQAQGKPPARIDVSE